ncbi:FMNH(2)-dependent dimethylsulfone monooxygenase (plasmid) [Sphingobium sp. AntQ-1]|uniref:LLM class flavin-dependent oxidoreductase n=1 Tax=Sphingobium sp. AntQ-1 TaxID=2930091 RepID=UPI00234E3986|nr:LLM class flavin-dependent oxidoreductase [Sphingobium sp. AntQ-1]WCP16283.1 FMNH(2)-dependent dimethylsulfone monooxygenase [Sphingobium sp. AntQ-1]
MSDATEPARARHTNPLLNQNRLKLGLFSINGTGAAYTNHPDRFDPTWANTRALVQLADGLGLEVLLSFARWKPFGGDGNASGLTLDPVSWAGAVAAVTEHIAIVSTMHVSVNHPLFVAKAGATIDRISNGRWGLNIVCGWYQAEIEMFGAALKAHEDRYGVADEWIEILERLWTEDKSFDYHGQHFDLKGLYSDPHPVQRRPVIMNAGGSPRGQDYAAQHADCAFVIALDSRPEAIRKQVDAYRKTAREKYGRELQIWTYAHVVQRDTVAQAQAYVDEYSGDQWGNHAAADAFIENNIATAKTAPPEVMASMKKAMMAGAGGIPLLGTPDDIAARMHDVSDAGVDGVLVNWLDYQSGLTDFGGTVLPLLERRGLRAPFNP